MMDFVIPNIYEPAKTDKVSLQANDITILVGKNGYGKSSFLHGVEETFKNDNSVIVVSWSDNQHGRGNGLSELFWKDDLEGVAAMSFRSEGQIMLESFGRFFMQRAGTAVRHREESQNTMFLLIDQLDSGLDSHQINDIKRAIRDTIIPDMNSKGMTVYCIMAANSYELVMGEDCLDPITRKHHKFKTIRSYMNYINRQYKDDD